MSVGRDDETRVSVLVKVERAEAFRMFTDEIDQWWQRGPRFRALGGSRAVIHLEPRVGGRLYESMETDAGETVRATGHVRVWEPPSRLVVSWRAVNFAPDEETEVEVVFAEKSAGTMVTVVHRGWSALRGDHPVRHGQETAVFLRRMGLWWGELLTRLRERATLPQ